MHESDSSNQYISWLQHSKGWYKQTQCNVKSFELDIHPLAKKPRNSVEMYIKSFYLAPTTTTLPELLKHMWVAGAEKRLRTPSGWPSSNRYDSIALPSVAAYRRSFCSETANILLANILWHFSCMNANWSAVNITVNAVSQPCS